MRKIIAYFQMSLDGFIEGPNGEMDWVMAEDEEVWRDLDLQYRILSVMKIWS
jgi:dihydrofolate reductase